MTKQTPFAAVHSTSKSQQKQNSIYRPETRNEASPHDFSMLNSHNEKFKDHRFNVVERQTLAQQVGRSHGNSHLNSLIREDFKPNTPLAAHANRHSLVRFNTHSSPMNLQRQGHSPQMPASASANGTISNAPPMAGNGFSASPTTRSINEIGNDFETFAFAYFRDNIEMELQNAAAIESISIGSRSAAHAAQMVQEVCEPYEKDQEIDTQILNTLFSVAGGGASVSEAGTSGTATGPAQELGSRGANVGSRIMRAGLGVVQAWLPTLAGYKTVGALKSAAINHLREAAGEASETSSPQFQEYEDEVMTAMYDELDGLVVANRKTIEDNPNPEDTLMVAKSLFVPTYRRFLLDKLRGEYGSRSNSAKAMISAITSLLRPKLASLRRHLDSAKQKREKWQALAAIGSGIAAGAFIGAGVGVWGGVTIAPAAVIGGIIGGVIGIGSAIAMLWD